MIIRACLDAFKKGRAVKQVGSRWEKDHINIFYMDGSFELQRRVGKVAREWAEIIGIPFIPVGDKYKSDVRVTFATGGSWSYVGTQALNIPPKEPTMQLGWLTDNSEDEELQQVVLHEFGHMVGLMHEHQNPNGGIKWDVERVYSYYMGYPHYWSKAQVDVNVFDKYSADMVKATEFDPKSIMLYPIPEEFTLDDYSVDWNLCISDIDRAFVRERYNGGNK